MTDGESPLEPAALRPGDSVLLAGPALTGKRHLLDRLLAGAVDDAAVLVTTKHSVDRVRDRFAGDGFDLRVVDCVTPGGSVGRAEQRPDTRYVSSAGDLTGIGIAASGFMQDLYHDLRRREARVGLHSLSTLLMYADVRRVYQFTHVLTTRVTSSGFGGAFVLDTVPGDDETLARLTQLFDGVVEVRRGDDRPELRARGTPVAPRSWAAFEPERV